MAALSAARNTPIMETMRNVKLSFPVKGSTTVYEGGMVCLNAGYLAPGSAAGSLLKAGVALKTVANAGADGAVTAEVLCCIAKFANKGADLVVAADVGGLCYFDDDQTVRHTSTSSSAAGTVIQIDSDGVWVFISAI